MKYLESKKSTVYGYSLFFFLLSLLSKAMAVSLPLVLLLTDYLIKRKQDTKTWLGKLPFFMLSILFGIIAIFAQKSSGSIQDFDVFPFSQRIIFACYGCITYLFKLVIPFHLSAVYPYPIKAGEAIPAQLYWYVILFLLFMAAICYAIKYSRKTAFGLLFFLSTVFLVLQLLPVGGAIMADRYAYIPSIGIFYLAGEGFYSLWNKAKSVVPVKALLTILSVVIVGFYTVHTYKRCTVWETGMSLWNDVISKEPTVTMAYNNRAALWIDEKNYEAAMNDYNKAIAIRSEYADAYQNRAVLFAGLNKNEEALYDYNKAIELKSNSIEAYNNRGMLLMNMQKYAEALNDFNKALDIAPDYAIVYNSRGNLFLNEGKYDQALQDYNMAIQLQPNYVQSYNGRGVLFMRQQKNNEAVAEFNRAIDVQPGYAEAYCNRAIAEYNLGRKDRACHDLQQAIDLENQAARNFYNQWCR